MAVPPNSMISKQRGRGDNIIDLAKKENNNNEGNGRNASSA
jgi:hypothetical protein